MTTITALPAAPARTMDAPTFVTTADTFVAALPTMVTQINTVAGEINTASTLTATNAAIASAAATDAVNYKNAVLSTANATPWVSGQVYAQYTNAISQINFQTYRKTTASSLSTTDPKNDPANWTLLQISAAWFVVNSNYTAVAGDNLLIDTSSAAVTVTLPSTFLVQYQSKISFKDLYGTFGTNGLTINYSGGIPIEGVLENMTVPNKNISFELLYVGGTRGWALV